HTVLALAIGAAVPLGQLLLQHHGKLAGATLAFLFYTYLVAVFYFMQSYDPRHIMGPVYFLTNVLALFATLVVATGDPRGISRRLAYVCAFAVALQGLFILQGFGLFARSIGSFNNPSQLGYWGLLVFCIFAV